MYARRAAPRLGPHVEMTPWRRGAPASRVRRRTRYADALRAYARGTAGGRPGERRAHEAGRRAGGGPSGRAVAGDCGDGAYPYEPRRPALLGAIFQVGPPARGARAGGWGRTRDGAGRARDGPSDVCDVSSQRRICDIHIAYGRYPGRSRWVCPGDMDIGAAIIAPDNRYRRAPRARTAAERRPQRAGRATEGGARVKAVSGYIVNRPGPLSLTPPSTSHTDPLVCGLRPGRSILSGPAALHPPLLFSEGRAPLEATGRRRRRRLRCLHGRRELLGGLAQNVLDRLLCRLDYCDARVRLEPIEDHLALERLLHARARLALLELLSTLQRLSL